MPKRKNWFDVSSTERTVAYTSGLNIAGTGASALAGLLVARLLGPSIRGEYAGITAWYGAALVAGELGQPAAICYFVAHEPQRARDYLATSRTLMLASGAVTGVLGWFLASALTNGSSSVTLGYRMVFLASPLIFIGGSYLFALQARSIRHWAMIRSLQPVLYLLGTVTLAVAHQLTLTSVLVVLVTTSLVQTAVAAGVCVNFHLNGGRPRRHLGRKVLRFGVSQVLATTPTTVSLSLDQLILSQAVASASLGQYAIAVSLTSLAYPLVTPIGSVLFPRLAAEPRASEHARHLQVRAVVTSLALSTALMAALALAAPLLVPALFGPAYHSAVTLIWILCPAGVFLSCNQVMGDLLRGRNETMLVAYAQGIGAVITVAMLLPLVPLLGVKGAAITSSAAYAATFGILLLAMGRQMPVSSRRIETSRAPWASFCAYLRIRSG